MLDFFRRHQRYFFFVITVVIIISFSFFGTYSALSSNPWGEQIAFVAVNGREVSRMDVDEMALFLGTDAQDKLLFGGAWGPNFLNNGVARVDFLQTGIGQELAYAYPQDLSEDIDKRLEKEKTYKPYVHPQAPFLSIENVWNYFAPEMKVQFDALQSGDNGMAPDVFQSRVNLYLSQAQIPDSTLRSILRYQEKQYSWLKPDERLSQTDLSLFGYHTLEDWFGPRFIRLVSEFIMNASILAEELGYSVSKGETLADLIRNTQISYQQNKNNPNLGVTSPEEYLNEQLRRMNMDQSRAVKIWTQVLLFRRYFQDAGANALVDSLANQRLHKFSRENVTVDLYRLPASLKIGNYEDLQKFEIYLTASAKQNKKEPLELPEQFLAVDAVEKQYPELVQKRYVLEVAQVDQKTLGARIALRELWNWEVSEQNWAALSKEFPILGTKPSIAREERFAALDSLDPTTRSLVDAFSKRSIVKANPEWIDEGLDAAKKEKKIVGLRMKGGKMPFSGMDLDKARKEFIRLLDAAPIGETVAVNSPLYKFSSDGRDYFRIAVLDRAKEKELLTFVEANQDGTLDALRDRILEKYYVANREKDASLYQKENKEWKPFREVRAQVADQYFAKVLLALEPIAAHMLKDEEPFGANPHLKDRSSSFRFFPHLNKIKEALEKDPAMASHWIAAKSKEEEVSSQLHERPTLSAQWKIEKSEEEISRESPPAHVDVQEAFLLEPKTWSSIQALPNGDLAFYQVKGRNAPSHSMSELARQGREMQTLLGAEAERHLMRQVIAELKSKNALSLDYLKVAAEDSPAGGNQMEPL